MRLLILAAALAALTPVRAQQATATLSGAQVVPATASAGTGTATATVLGAQLRVSGSVSGVSGVTAAHVHGPATAGVNGPVVFTLTTTAGQWDPMFNSFPLTAAQQADLVAGRYYVDVHTAANPAGEIRGQFAVPRPVNDDIDFATELSPDAPLDVRVAATAAATADPLVSEPAASCAPSGNTRSVWWHVRSNSVSNATVAIDLSGSSFDTVLSVYTYNGSTFTEVACNDDLSASVLQSRISGLALATGFSYYVRVAGFGAGAAGAGSVQIALTSSAPFEPSNHTWRPRGNFGSRFVAAGPRLGYNAGASATVAGEPTAPASCASVGSHAVWWEYDAAQTGFLTLDTIGSGFDTVLMVTDFNGTVLACNDDLSNGVRQSRIADLPVTPSGRYLIRVASYNPGTTGTIRLNTAFSTATPGESGAPESGSPEARVAFGAPRPNPTAGRTSLAFALDAPGQARLSVVDALGREVAVLWDGPAAAGETPVAFDTSGLPAGVYAARLSAGGQTATQRVTVVR